MSVVTKVAVAMAAVVGVVVNLAEVAVEVGQGLLCELLW